MSERVGGGAGPRRPRREPDRPVGDACRRGDGPAAAAVGQEGGSLQTSPVARAGDLRDPRRAILDAAEALLVEGGPEGFSVRRLVARCGVSAPTIYHHFGDKQGLVDALLEERLAELVRELEAARRAGDPLGTLRAYLRLFAGFGLRNPSHYRLLALVREPELPPPPAAERIRVLLREPLLRLEEEGRLRVANAEVAQQVLWALVHGLISLQAARPDHPWAPGLVDEALAAALRGTVRGSEPEVQS